MGVYISGMEMPKEGSWITLRVFPDGKCVIHSWCGNDDEIKFEFMEHLIAATVPPHGRLIDADALLFECNTGRIRSGESFVTRTYVNDAPTIIEAEGESNGQTKNNKP